MADTSQALDKQRSQALGRSESSSKLMRTQPMGAKPASRHQALEGGWGWMVVLGCSLGHFLVVGLARTLGVFYVEWVERFEGSAAATAWVQSLFNTIRMVLGPLVSMLCDAVGCRKVVMMGGLVFSIGCLVSSFATSLKFLYCSFSLLAGMGASCIFTPMFVMVNHYFEKKKGIAMALGTVGSGLGTLVLAPLETMLLEAYGHYGAMFIISGIMLNTVVVGALFRPLESKLNWPREVLVKERPGLVIMVGTDEEDEAEDLLHEDETVEQLADNAEMNSEKKTNNSEQTDSSEGKKSSSQCSQTPMDKRAVKRTPSQMSQDNQRSRKPLVKRVPSQSGQDMKRIASRASQMQAEETPENQDQTKCAMLKQRFAILKRITFWIYSFYIAALPCGVQIFVIYTPSLMKERGFSEAQAALVLAIGGGCDIAGRFLAGFIFDLNFVRHRRWPTHCCYGIGLGLVVIWTGYQHSLVGFIAMSLLWGLFEGGYHSQRATIVSEFITRDQIASSVGFMIFWQGIGNMMSPTFAGFLKDKTGTFTTSFLYGGCAMLFCALLFLGNFIVVYIQSKRASKEEKQFQQRPNVV